MEYTTQMDAARKGIATPQMKAVAEKEHMPLEQLMELVEKGQVAICANKAHTCLDPQGVGSMLRTKINVNLGVSRDCKDYNIEMKKVQSAIDLGAEAIMDLSSHGPRHDWHGAGVRQRHPLPEGLGDSVRPGFHRRGAPPRGGRRGLCHPALRHHPQDH